MRHRPVADIAHLPTYGFGPQSPIWWGTMGFIALEGTGFALAVGTYLYLGHLAPTWPIAPKQENIWAATILTFLLLASVVPNLLLDRWARQQNLRKVRIGLVVMSLFGVAPLIARIFEFQALTVLWDANAYGSVVWFLLGLHTAHLLTDAGDTIVLAVLMFTRHSRTGKRFSDVTDNAFYWHFVVASWLPIYLLLYWVQ
ncbi:cytochrome c oxidase subunit 3 [Inquilinus limosus]|uniref:cytochrome c oxidase subunit 3 n=1 Tax=Inquilinus limosus TaxID=171674 RepID=UPI003F171F53